MVPLETESMMSETKELRAPYDRNTATLPDVNVSHVRNRHDKREKVANHKLISFDARLRRTDPHTAGIVEVIDARFYMGRSSSASVVHCSLWVRTRDGRYFSGEGQAGGYGYHKTSAALDAAVDSAGIKLEKRFDGCGETAMHVALLAIGRACGYARLPMRVVVS